MQNRTFLFVTLFVSQLALANGGNWFGGPSGAEMDRHLDRSDYLKSYYEKNPDKVPVFDSTSDGQLLQRLDNKTGKLITQGDVEARKTERAQEIERHAARNPRTAQQIDADMKKIIKIRDRYEATLNEYRNIKKDPSLAQYSQASWGPEIKKLNVDSLVGKHGFDYSFGILSKEISTIEKQSDLMKQTIKYHADIGTTKSQLHTRPRTVGTKVMKAVGPFAAVAAALGYGGANAAEASPLAEKNNSHIKLGDDSRFQVDSNMTDKLGGSSFGDLNSQK